MSGTTRGQTQGSAPTGKAAGVGAWVPVGAAPCGRPGSPRDHPPPITAVVPRDQPSIGRAERGRHGGLSLQGMRRGGAVVAGWGGPLWPPPVAGFLLRLPGHGDAELLQALDDVAF